MKSKSQMGGNLSVSDQSAIVNNAYSTSSKLIEVDTSDIAKGIFSSNASAINFPSEYGGLYQIWVKSGMVSSSASLNHSATIYNNPNPDLSYYTAIRVGDENQSGAEILNIADITLRGDAIFSNYNSNDVVNYGKIKSNGNQDSYALYLADSNDKNTYKYVQNYGEISGNIFLEGNEAWVYNSNQAKIYGSITTNLNSNNIAYINGSGVFGSIDKPVSITSQGGALQFYSEGYINYASVDLGNSAQSFVNISSGQLVGNIKMGNENQYFEASYAIHEGSINGQGSAIFKMRNHWLYGNIGDVTKLKKIEIDTGSISNNINGNFSINTNSIVFKNNGSINLGSAYFKADEINGSEDNQGTINVGSVYYSTYETPATINFDAIGQTHAINSMNIASSSKAVFNNNTKISNLNIAGTADLKNNISMTGSSINGSEDNQGTINLLANSEVNFDAIGQTHAINSMNIASSSKAVFNNNTKISNLEVDGELQFKSPLHFEGDISIKNNAIFDFGKYSQAITGNLNFINSNVIKISSGKNNSIATLAVAGIVMMQDDVVLKINLNNFTLANGAYTILSGSDGSYIGAIPDNKVDVNNSGSNKIGNNIFSTSVKDNTLILNISTVQSIENPNTPQENPNTPQENPNIPKFIKNDNQEVLYQALSESQEPGRELKLFMEYLDSDQFNEEEKTSALISTMPQNDNSTNLQNFDNLNNSSNAIFGRIDNNLNYNDDKKLSNNFIATNQRQSRVMANNNFVTINQKQSWITYYKFDANQNSTQNQDGFTNNGSGFIFGFDTKLNKSTLGIALGYSSSKIKSKDSNKALDLESYQISLYSGYEKNNYFLNSAVGFYFNDYNSSRIIPLLNLEARGQYNGQTYFVKSEFGKKFISNDQYFLSPSISLSYAQNRFSKYTESGAQSLNLEISNKPTELAEGKLAFNLGKKFSSKKINIQPSLFASYGYNFIKNGQESTINFQNQNYKFKIISQDIARENVQIGSNLDIVADDVFSLTLNYNENIRKDYKSKQASIEFKYSF